MKRLLVLLPLMLGASEDFISHYEYGEMLYNNPRGVSCAQCHGEDGKGATIVEFRDIHGKEVIKGSNIVKADLESMIKSVNSYHEIMPRYYLTNEEVETIYNYLQKRNKKYVKKEDNSTN